MAISAEDKSIKIPDQHYVGFQKRSADDLPLGFMTPDGTDAAATKRKATVDSWAKGGYYGQKQNNLPAQTFKNSPMSGFKMGRSVRHGNGWGQGNVAWRIEDPRGFELEISSPNLAQIMTVTTIENGEILEKCVWGRLGKDNILIPISSEVYKTAVANTERINKSASLKDLKPGQNIVLQNGIEGRYLGYHYSIERGDAHDNYNGYGAQYLHVKLSSKKRHFVYEEKGKGNTKVIHSLSSLKISEIIAGNEITMEEAELELNKLITAGTTIYSAGYSTTYAVTNKPIKDFKYDIAVETGGVNSAVPKNRDDYYRYSLAEFIDDTFCYVSNSNVRGYQGTLNSEVSGTVFDKALYQANGTIKHDLVKDHRAYWYGNKGSDMVPRAVKFDPSDATITWYRAQVSFKTSSGFEMTKKF